MNYNVNYIIMCNTQYKGYKLVFQKKIPWLYAGYWPENERMDETEMPVMWLYGENLKGKVNNKDMSGRIVLKNLCRIQIGDMYAIYVRMRGIL